MAVTLTPKAVTKVKEIIAGLDDPKPVALRLSVLGVAALDFNIPCSSKTKKA